jgi:hypothetical protein
MDFFHPRSAFLKTSGTGNHFLHKVVFGAGFFEVVINSPDRIKAFTELDAGTKKMFSYRYLTFMIHKRYTR